MKDDFKQVPQSVSLNGTIVIFKAGKITLAEKVSGLCLKAWPNLAAGSYNFLLFEAQRCVFVQVSRACVCRLIPTGPVLLVCTKPPCAGLDTKADRAAYCLWWSSSWPVAVLLAQPSIWRDGAGRQPRSHRAWSWLVLLDAAVGLTEAEQPCHQGISCCFSHILPKLGCSVSLGPLLTIRLDQVKVLALYAQSAAWHDTVISL